MRGRSAWGMANAGKGTAQLVYFATHNDCDREDAGPAALCRLGTWHSGLLEEMAGLNNPQAEGAGWIELTDELLAELEAKARAATPGAWEYNDMPVLVRLPDEEETAALAKRQQGSVNVDRAVWARGMHGQGAVYRSGQSGDDAGGRAAFSTQAVRRAVNQANNDMAASILHASGEEVDVKSRWPGLPWAFSTQEGGSLHGGRI